jgi:hypothetical protein
MSLPHLLRMRLDAVPSRVPYLKPDSQLIEEWRHRLNGEKPLKVGIVWAGNPRHSHDEQRSIPSSLLLPALVMTNVHLYSLQKEPRPSDYEVVNRFADCVTDLSSLLGDFSETAAAIMALDLIITVDTSVAHLAGALGRPVWTMLPFALDWRWMLEREDSPWYPTMRLFRQPRSDDWCSVIARVQIELTKLAATFCERPRTRASA